jgi:hypothetical protein
METYIKDNVIYITYLSELTLDTNTTTSKTESYVSRVKFAPPLAFCKNAAGLI